MRILQAAVVSLLFIAGLSVSDTKANEAIRERVIAKIARAVEAV